MHLSTYFLPLAFALATADVSFGPPPSNPTFPAPNPQHPTFAPSPTFGSPPSNPSFPVPNPLHPTFFSPPPNQARAEEIPTFTEGHPTHPLTRRQDVPHTTPFNHFPGGHVFVEKHAPRSSTDPVALPPAHPSFTLSSVQQPTWAPSSGGGAYTGHPSPLPTSGLSISTLPTSIIVDTSTSGYSHETSTHPASQTIVTTLAIPSTSVTVDPNPGGPVNTFISVPPTYLNSTVTTKPATGITTSTKVTTPPASLPTGSGTSSSGSSSASPSPTTSLGNVLEWNAVLFVAGFMGVFAFGML